MADKITMQEDGTLAVPDNPDLILTYTIGTVLREFTDAKLGHRFADESGIPLAAGLIVGEALVGVGYSLMVVFTA